MECYILMYIVDTFYFLNYSLLENGAFPRLKMVLFTYLPRVRICLFSILLNYNYMLLMYRILRC
jgi:hypothetical protein